MEKNWKSKFLKTQMRKEGNWESNQKLNKIKKEKEEKVTLTTRYPKKKIADWTPNGYQGIDEKKGKKKERKIKWQLAKNI